jgi:hypothetical protein
MKQHTDEITPHDEIELIELGSVSEETRGVFGAFDEGGELPFTRQIM